MLNGPIKVNIQQALAEGARQLTGTDSPEVDSRYLLCHVLACQNSYLFTWPDKELTPEQQQHYQQYLQQRCQGQPIAYITGTRGFWSLDLDVNNATLIPRPETELLVELALDKIQAGMTVADLGTGSGAIALAIATERKGITLIACDASVEALSVAKANAERCVGGAIHFWQGEWLSAIQAKTVDIVVSNPPYIEQDDPHLSQGDVRFEPLSALVSGETGLDDIKSIINQAAEAVLKPQGWLLLEHGYQQAVPVRQCMEQAGFTAVQSVKDFAGNDRVTLGQLPV